MARSLVLKGVCERIVVPPSCLDVVEQDIQHTPLSIHRSPQVVLTITNIAITLLYTRISHQIIMQPLATLCKETIYI